MPRRLLILRHAKSSWDSGASTDFERPLAKRGKRDAPRMGHWLKKQHLKLGHVVSSPAERARQTTLEVCKVLGVKKKRISWDDRIYDGYTKQLLQVLADVPRLEGNPHVICIKRLMDMLRIANANRARTSALDEVAKRVTLEQPME